MTGVRVTATITMNKFPQLRSRFPVVVNAIMSKAIHDVYAKSQQTVPVRKDQSRVLGGSLKASGQVKYSNYEGEVSYSIHYAVYVHQGTRHMAARPFLFNALKEVEPGLAAAFRQLESRIL